MDTQLPTIPLIIPMNPISLLLTHGSCSEQPKYPHHPKCPHFASKMSTFWCSIRQGQTHTQNFSWSHRDFSLCPVILGLTRLHFAVHSHVFCVLPYCLRYSCAEETNQASTVPAYIDGKLESTLRVCASGR